MDKKYNKDNKPSMEDALEAIRTMIRWAGDDPNREGLIDTPRRVLESYDEFFNGYYDEPAKILGKTFNEVGGYDDFVLLRDIELISHCEHHMIPFLGNVHIAYMPNDRVAGISKLARIVDTFAKRLQTQETLTAQIKNSIDKYLEPKGTAVYIEAIHQCMSLRGVKKSDVATITTQFSGVFASDKDLRERFLSLVNRP